MMYLHQKICLSDAMIKEVQSYSSRTVNTKTKLSKERKHIDDSSFCKYLNPELLLKDMRLKVKMMRTLTSIFVPLRRGWRLDVNENQEIREHTRKLQEMIGNNRHQTPLEVIQYE